MKRLLLTVSLICGTLYAADANSSSAATTSAQPSEMTDPATAQAPETKLGRWLDVTEMSGSLRYRSTANTNGVHMFENGQHREMLTGRVKLDADGKYSIHFHASSGRYFNWAYADVIGGQFSDNVPAAGKRRSAAATARTSAAIVSDPEGPIYAKGIVSRGGYFYMRQLYFSATPVKALTFEFGSLAIEKGANTEITSFDNDGYITGERLRIHDARHLFFSEIAGTWAYLGDPFVPNFFARGQRLGENNYQQYLVRKDFGKRLTASADYTRLRGTNTLREGISASVREAKVIDSARVELYQRTNTVSFYGTAMPSGNGFSASIGKNLRKRLQVEGGYASIDDNYAVYSGSPFLRAVAFAWNSDSFSNGKRVFARSELKVAPGLSLFGFYTHETDPAKIYTVNHQSINAGFNFDCADLLHRAHIL